MQRPRPGCLPLRTLESMVERYLAITAMGMYLCTTTEFNLTMQQEGLEVSLKFEAWKDIYYFNLNIIDIKLEANY